MSQLCTSPGSMTAPGNVVCVPQVTHSTGTPVVPHVQVAAPLVHLASHAPLPFTGADVQELAVIGLGAVLAGGLLLIRRRRHATV
jgi:LPXTG-motif cell wall-anchored protein